jgi:hypothetical protein
MKTRLKVAATAADAGGSPIGNGTWTANFDCIVPASVASGPAEAGRPFPSTGVQRAINE